MGGSFLIIQKASDERNFCRYFRQFGADWYERLWHWKSIRRLHSLRALKSSWWRPPRPGSKIKREVDDDEEFWMRLIWFDYPSDVEEDDVEDAEDGRGEPDGEEREEGEGDAPDESEWQGQQAGQESIDPISGASEEDESRAPDRIESVSHVRLGEHVFKVELSVKRQGVESISNVKTHTHVINIDDVRQTEKGGGRGKGEMEWMGKHLSFNYSSTWVCVLASVVDLLERWTRRHNKSWWAVDTLCSR